MVLNIARAIVLSLLIVRVGGDAVSVSLLACEGIDRGRVVLETWSATIVASASPVESGLESTVSPQSSALSTGSCGKAAKLLTGSQLFVSKELSQRTLQAFCWPLHHEAVYNVSLDARAKAL